MIWLVYTAGLFTIPMLVWLLGKFVDLLNWLADRGWSYEVKTDRKPHEVQQHMIERDIWYERQRGPIFTGHWYRKRGTSPIVTRWVGIGSAEGRSLMIFHKRLL